MFWHKRKPKPLANEVDMVAKFGAPEGCQLAPIHCVQLFQSIREASNEPPLWIWKATMWWLDKHGLSIDATIRKVTHESV
jgi:hypothetical protein